MPSLKQIEANRRNAQKSTGPRTVEGKAASSRNALKSGIEAGSQILPGENPGELESLTAEYYGRYRPVTPEARHLVDTLVSNEWLLRRFRRIEVRIVQHELIAAGSFLDKKNPIGHAYMRSDRSLERLQRRINAAERNYHRALKELQSLPPGNGFVPQSPVEHPAEAQPVEVPAPAAAAPEPVPAPVSGPGPAADLPEFWPPPAA